MSWEWAAEGEQGAASSPAQPQQAPVPSTAGKDQESNRSSKEEAKRRAEEIERKRQEDLKVFIIIGYALQPKACFL